MKILSLHPVNVHLHTIFTEILRGGAVVARWAHNPKVTGSSPVPATCKTHSLLVEWVLLLLIFGSRLVQVMNLGRDAMVLIIW